MTGRPQKTPKNQSERFIEAAKTIGADDDEATFKAKLGMIAKATPKDDPKSRK